MTIQLSPSDAERFAWEALKLQASTRKAADLGSSFTASGEGDDSLFWVTVALLTQVGLLPSLEKYQIHGDATIRTAVREVFYTALRLGIIIPGQLGQAYDWNSSQGAYQFTRIGREFFQQGTVSISVPNQLVTRIKELTDAGHLDPGIVPFSRRSTKLLDDELP